MRWRRLAARCETGCVVLGRSTPEVVSYANVLPHMAHSHYLRRMARLLRVEQRLTVDQLAARLALPRSTVYYWVRDLPLGEARGEACAPRPGTEGGRRAAPASAGRAPGRAMRRTRRLRSFDDLAAQPTFRDFVCLYVARGSTRERARVSLSDSDAAVMRLANRWMLRLSDRSPPLGSLRARPEPDRSCGVSGAGSSECRRARSECTTRRELAGADTSRARARHGVLR